MAKRIDVLLGGNAYECFLLSTTERENAATVDGYIVAGVGSIVIDRSTGAVVSVAPLLDGGAVILEQLAPLIFEQASAGT